MRIIKPMFLFTFLFILFHFSPQLAAAETLDNDQVKLENEEDDADYIEEADTVNESGDTNHSQNNGETEPKDDQDETELENNGNVSEQEENSSGSDSTEQAGEDSGEQEGDADPQGNHKDADDTSIENNEAEEPENSREKYQVSSNQELEIGVRDPKVIDLKNDLGELGFLSFPNPTEYFGEITEQGVKDFQEQYDMPVTGVADADTVAKIEEIVSSPFQNGERHPDSVELKENLQKLGFVSFVNPPNDYFGSQTERAVRDFQEHHGLLVTGIADPVTKDKIEELANAPLSYGMNRADAVVLKENLDKLGFASFNGPNDYFGTKTEQGVKDFQEQYDMPVTGVADADTVAKIEEIVSSPFQNGERHPDSVELKENLQKLGFVSFVNPPNDYFGSQTERAVKDFQVYHSLQVNGIADELTRTKIKDVLSSPFQNGERHPDSIELKENLQRLGFVSFANAPNNYFGSQTEQAVKDFQVYHSLPVSGIADEPTRTKIEEVISSPLQYGKHHPDNVGLKLNLDKLGYASFDNPNDYFGSKTEQGVKDFQEDYGFPISGIADKKTMLAIAEAAASRDYTEYNLTLSEALAMQMAVNPQTDNNYAYVSKSHIDDNNRVTANVLNVRPSPNTNREAIGQLEYNTRVTILEDLGNWYRIEYTSNAWKTASQEDTLYYLDPNNFINDEKQIFQFLDLSRPSNASAEVLNNYLDGRGILDGQGQAFIDASIQNGVSDIYLLSHALLETGNGTSTLATGVEVNGRTVYNMYGIGANDNCPLECGSQRAYEEGWFTPYDAIVGGAEFIGNSYIKSGQNTLYSMRWNPRAMERDGYAHHQYATDIGWASKQISDMYDLYQDIGMRNLVLDIPLFQ